MSKKDFARARNTDPKTSHGAAASMQGTAEKLTWRVAKYVRSCGLKGATAEETSDALGVDKQSITPRFVTLLEKGVLIEAGIERINRSKRKALVRIHRDFGPTSTTRCAICGAEIDPVTNLSSLVYADGSWTCSDLCGAAWHERLIER